MAYYQHDHLATPQKLIDSSGKVVWRAQQTAFGETQVNTGTVTNNLRFPGQYYDGETGLHYNWFRYYEPETGRYVTSDPIGLRGGINTYGYVWGNPLIYVDPSGRRGNCVQCILDCNTILGWDTDGRLDQFLDGDTACKIGTGSARPGGVTTCRIGNIGLDFGREFRIGRDFQRCLEGCSQECENESQCK